MSDEDNRRTVDLKAIYLTTLQRCDPEVLVRARLDPSMPRNVVAIGKCAGAMLDGVRDVDDAFVAIPNGYRLPRTYAEVRIGGHPSMTKSSFEAGHALLAFIERHDDILFLVSGGGSACVEVPAEGFSEEEVAEANETLIASGQPIGAINAARRKMSAIKGGRLAQRVRGRAVTLVYSDVSTNRLEDVASGPTIPGSDALLIADNTTLVRTAAALIGERAVVVEQQIEGDVAEAARTLAHHASRLEPGQILVAGGEPTVAVRGDGRGGRCSELAVRFAAHCTYETLFASTDGVDGNSGVAGFHLPARTSVLAATAWERELAVSNSYRIAAQVGEPIMISPTGNNLRDLFLVTRP